MCIAFSSSLPAGFNTVTSFLSFANLHAGVWSGASSTKWSRKSDDWYSHWNSIRRYALDRKWFFKMTAEQINQMVHTFIEKLPTIWKKRFQDPVPAWMLLAVQNTSYQREFIPFLVRRRWVIFPEGFPCCSRGPLRYDTGHRHSPCWCPCSAAHTSGSSGA